VKKQLTNIIVLSSLIFGINTANADTPTAELRVIGTLAAPGCTVIADSVYDFGRVSASVVQSGTTTSPLTAITKTWVVNCDADTHLSFSPVDNRAASVAVAGPNHFGMGNVNGTGKIGHYTARIHNATVDGVASGIFHSLGGGPGIATDLRTDASYGWWSTSTSSQSIGKLFTTDITVSPILAGADTMGGPINDDVNLDGSMTIGFTFGI
jgi:hypothetical protein